MPELNNSSIIISFLNLPAKIRLQIYRDCFQSNDDETIHIHSSNICSSKDDKCYPYRTYFNVNFRLTFENSHVTQIDESHLTHKYDAQAIVPSSIALLRTCKSIQSEASEALYSGNTFNFNPRPEGNLYPILKSEIGMLHGKPSSLQVIHEFLLSIGKENRRLLRHVYVEIMRSEYVDLLKDDSGPVRKTFDILHTDISLATLGISFHGFLDNGHLDSEAFSIKACWQQDSLSTKRTSIVRYAVLKQRI